MLAIAARNAPETTSKVIGNYRARVVFFGTMVICGLMITMVWFIPIAEPNSMRFRVWMTAGLIAFLIAWWAFVWGAPAHRYRKLRSMGYIIEIRDPDIQAYAKGYWKPIEVHLDAIRKAEGAHLEVTLLELCDLLGSGPDPDRAAMLDRLASEQERLKALRPS